MRNPAGRIFAIGCLTTAVLGGLLMQFSAGAQPPAPVPVPAPDSAEKKDAPPASAAISPDGLRAAWAAVDRKSVLSATRASAGAEWAAPMRLLTTRGTVGKIVFSPDGKSIAYENPRTWRDDGSPNDTWGFICVYDIATRQISHVDPSFNIDVDPQWSPDGTEISFTRKFAGLPDARLTRPVTRLKLQAWQPPPLRPSERFTMAAVLAAPFVYPPAPSGDGQSIGYVTREAQHRNIYFLRVGEPARRIVNYAGDDGQDLKDLTLSQTGAAAAYVRGDNLNRQGDAPNPNAVADMPQQQVWILGTRDDAPRLLGAGNDPLFTPDSRYILWRSGATVMAAALTWEGDRLLGVGAPEEFLADERSGLRFSPDGAMVAYERGTDIEVHDFASKTTVVIPRGTGIARSPTWSPDSRRLAFRRESNDAMSLIYTCPDGLMYRYCGPMVSKEPWSIWTVDVAELKNLVPRKVWQADPGRGSVYYPLDQSNSPGQHGDQMFWSANDRIAFVWERDGWRHLYSVAASGGKAALLTPGNGEVETAALSLDRKQLVYASNIGDLGRRHISAVGFDGTPARPLTRGEKSQWSPTPLAGGKIAYIGAGWADPPAIAVRDVGGATVAAALPTVPASFPTSMLVEPQLVEFPAADRKTAYGHLFVPRQPNGCAIIFSHGGIRRQMLPGFHYMDAYTYLYEMNQYLASRGCVVLSVEYRSSIMRGEAFRNAPGWGFAGTSELLDFVGAAKYLMKRKDVDARRGVGIYGLSWGGYMTANALAQRSDLFTVGFDMAGVHTAPDALGQSHSATGHIDTWTSPVFVAHGDDDMNVDMNEGIALVRALQAKRPNVKLKQQVYPGQTHDLYQTFEQLVGVYTDGSDFMLEQLGVK